MDLPYEFNMPLASELSLILFWGLRHPTSAYVDPSAITLAAIQIVFITLYIPCLATVLRFSLIPLQTILLHQDQDKMQPLGLC